ncbi:YnbE family lipoprotein [Sphingomonas mesophila]|uniref:YnbE family lipoprotein n=1 Tax=Sphingomonas mesophila TaxID=2303576 RepID=UPI000E57B180|nr:YnbE family lipoprotein [Sphingomonas mesophila]
MTRTTALRLGAATLLLPVTASCVTVRPPDKPIEINLNVKIEQEVLVRLQRDVDQLIKNNPDAFPQQPEGGVPRQ